jgi:short-subunit dehydrogenase
VAVAHLAVDFGHFDAKAQAQVAVVLEAKAVAVLVNNVGMSYPYCQVSPLLLLLCGSS